MRKVKIKQGYSEECTYDDCGRLIAVESSAGVTSLSWDYEDRLIGITYPNSSTNSFGYNPFGARVSKSDSTGNYTFMRNGTGVIAPVLSDSYAEYTPGISERRNNNSTYYHSDLKNTTTQTASNETISGTNVYDAFGNLVDYSGTWSGPFAYGGAFGYQSDDDSGLMLLGHRYYDPSTGRFLSRDPAQTSTNWYKYASANPVVHFDSSGLAWETTVDILGVALSAKDFIEEPSFVNGLWLLGDIVGALLPFVPSPSTVRQAAKIVSKLDDADIADIAINGWRATKLRHLARHEAIKVMTEVAEVMYPKLAGKRHKHHINPRYLGHNDGVVKEVDAAYHQFITNAFRREHAYGKGIISNKEKLDKILREVYEKFPIN